MTQFAGYFAATLSIVLGAFGQLLLKMGATRLSGAGQSTGFMGQVGNLLWNWPLLLGFGLYAASAIIWVYVLSRIELSVAYPMVGLGFAVVLMLSVTVLGETVSLSQLAGCALIVLGILFVTKG
ncbi:EamA family transporter [Rubellimicrobium arenae]|uniref:EamA family transporter n=1 Tax=Rubellimicrobium arenae TaxID=2817372 RepID=UPI001B313F23|nr:EamA family transporter [Rubellimicrobium arenae]